jgi:hypothetical protein
MLSDVPGTFVGAGVGVFEVGVFDTVVGTGVGVPLVAWPKAVAGSMTTSASIVATASASDRDPTPERGPRENF